MNPGSLYKPAWQYICHFSFHWVDCIGHSLEKTSLNQRPKSDVNLVADFMGNPQILNLLNPQEIHGFNEI